MVRAYCKAISFLLLLGMLASCKKDKPNPPVTPPPGHAGKRLFVVCEGSMGNGNSSLELYLPEKDSVFEDIYQAVNQQSLGDVFQSMTRIGDELYLCINNSDKILVLDAHTYQRTGTISVPKPRYLLALSPQKAFVSTLFSNKLYVVNPQSRQVLQSIDLPRQNPEGMLLRGHQLWVCPWDTATQNIYLVDTALLQLSDSIAIAGRAPQEMVSDKLGRIWVLSGNVAKGKDAALTVLDPVGHSILKSYAFPAGADPIRPVLSPGKDSLYFIEVNYSGGTQHNGIYRMGISDAALPAQPFVAAQQFQYFWGLDIDAATGIIYIADPKGFVQKGRVLRYRPDGTKLGEFATGVGPGHFYFD